MGRRVDRRRVRLAHQQFFAALQHQFYARGRALELYRLHRAADMNIARLVKPDMLRAQGKRARLAAEFAHHGVAQHVRGTDEARDKRRARTHVELARRVYLLDAPVVKHRHPVGHRQRFALIVRDKHKRNAERALQVFQLHLHLLAQFEIERAERFVEQQHARLVHQRAGDGDALALAAGELRRFTRMGKAERHPLQRLAGAGQPRFFIDAFDHQPVGDVLQHRHMRKQRVILKHRVNVALPRRQLAGFAAKQANRAVAQLLKARDHPQAGGFAGAGRPQHGEKLPVFDGHADVIDRAHVAVAPRDLLKLHCVSHTSPALSARP
ncbi:hypothetical protein BN136_3670 [Cronobacter universalis NCTC 9529]|nr:hypothetical protein BN136_3670 [Cronobacter universalis NCTC 9529]